MIFVTVSGKEFERLVKKMDLFALKSKEDIVIQIGKTVYEPKHAVFFRFASQEKIKKYIEKSDIVISHGGTGSIMTSLSLNKPTIIVPRYKKYDESVDDHQVQITEELEKQKRIIAVYDLDDIEKSIKKARALKSKSRKSIKLIKFLDNYIQKLGD